MKNLGYLASAYTAIWLVLSFFLARLYLKNQKLNREVDHLESRIKELETKRGSGAE